MLVAIAAAAAYNRRSIDELEKVNDAHIQNVEMLQNTILKLIESVSVLSARIDELNERNETNDE